MNTTAADFYNSNLSQLGYSSKLDIINNLYLKALIESYGRLDKAIGIENHIRDRFRNDLYHNDASLLKKWLQIGAIFLDWENWGFTADGTTLSRSDFVFKFSGMCYVIECKRLKSADKAYIDEGLERFISLKYAEGDEYAGMIGFVIAGDKSVICSGLRKKIGKLEHTRLVSDISPIPSFDSLHTRIDASKIEVNHLFFDFQLS